MHSIYACIFTTFLENRSIVSSGVRSAEERSPTQFLGLPQVGCKLFRFVVFEILCDRTAIVVFNHPS